MSPAKAFPAKGRDARKELTTKIFGRFATAQRCGLRHIVGSAQRKRLE